MSVKPAESCFPASELSTSLYLTQSSIFELASQATREATRPMAISANCAAVR